MAGYRETLPRFNSRVVHRPKNDLAQMRFLPVSTGLGCRSDPDCDLDGSTAHPGPTQLPAAKKEDLILIIAVVT
jgi:hypothetical protein